MIPSVGSIAGTWALVPVKRFSDAKSRLEAVLGSAERVELAKAMLKDVLDALSGVRGLDGVLVVTRDGEARSIACSVGARVLDDPVEAGTNAAVMIGVHHLTAARAAGALVVPGDVPFIVAGEIEAALAAMRTHAVVLAPARRDGGTNLLGLSGPDAIVPAFGADSFAGHLAAAGRNGLEPAILKLDGAGNDIDVPADLLTGTPSAGRATRTSALLSRLAAIGFHAAFRRFQELSCHEQP